MSESSPLAAIFRPVSLAMAIVVMASIAPADTNLMISTPRTASAVSLAFVPAALPTAITEPKAAVAPMPGSTTGPSPTSVTGPVSMVAGAHALVAQTGTWTFDLFDPRADRWQDPDLTACTAASLQSMLNTIAYTGSDPTLVWQPNSSYAKQESILAYERAHMTMLKSSAGSDPHGWRNALNYFGWGSVKAGVYVDAAYKSFDAAAKAVVKAIATTARPVGILAEYGRHAEFVTGYKVRGADPSTGSSDFTVIGVYLTDPHQAAGHRDTWVTYSRWKTGEWRIRFTEFGQVDSPGRDPLDHHVARREWLGKWVIVAPVR